MKPMPPSPELLVAGNVVFIRDHRTAATVDDAVIAPSLLAIRELADGLQLSFLSLSG